MNDYKMKLLAHLATYKKSVLGVHEDGVWSRNKQAYAHILPSDKSELNLVSGVRGIWSGNPKAARIKRHRDFHHLNSSQAFAINLFFPLLHYHEAHAGLLSALGVPEARIADWNFEVMVDRAERTNFDLVLQLEGQQRVFVEVKLTEAEFGSVSDSDTQRRRRETIYLSRLEEKVDIAALDIPGFFRMYQLLRNASYATASGDSVIFVVPRQNRAVAEAAALFTSKVVTAPYQARIRTVFAEDIVASLLLSDIPKDVLSAVLETADKYVLRQPAGLTLR